MAKPDQHQPAERLLVVMPTWFGDSVMATPLLRALRALWPDAYLAVLIRESLAELVEGLSSVDEVIPVLKGKRGSAFGTSRRLRTYRFDTAVLLPNSFRAASIAAMAGIPRRIGYDRDGRGLLLTDRLIAPRDAHGFTPVPTLEYYLSMAHYLGASPAAGDHRMEVATRPEDDRRAASLLTPAKGRPVVLMNPGAREADKRWPAERFAQLAARCTRERGWAVAITGSPEERQVLARVSGAATTALIDLPKAGMSVRLLKSVCKQCALVVTNDTGPRHLAAACGTPVVSLFGPTTPAWTEIDFAWERQVLAADVGKPGSMKQIPVEEVYAAAVELLDSAPSTSPTALSRAGADSAADSESRAGDLSGGTSGSRSRGRSGGRSDNA